MLDLGEQRVHVDSPVQRPVPVQPALGFRELPLAAGLVPALRVIPGYGHVNETLEEVALGVGSRAPLVLELLVRVEVVACANQLYAALESHSAIIGRP